MKYNEKILKTILSITLASSLVACGSDSTGGNTSEEKVIIKTADEVKAELDEYIEVVEITEDN